MSRDASPGVSTEAVTVAWPPRAPLRLLTPPHQALIYELVQVLPQRVVAEACL